VLLGGLSGLAVVLGAATAYLAHRYPQRRPMMQFAAGWLLIAGFALLGATLTITCGACQQH
jgi:uncharacterized membrane protein YadS